MFAVSFRNSYIFTCLMLSIVIWDKVREFFSRRPVKSWLYGSVLLALVFFVCNNLILPWYVRQGGQVTVPTVVGIRYEVGQRMLDSLGLITRLGDLRTDKNFPEGTVIGQNPASGRTVKRGRRVYLTISSGEQLVTVPSLKGRTLRDARFQLEQLALKLGAIEYRASEEFPENTVIEQSVASGGKVKKEVFVSVVVSQGKMSDKVPVPELNGKTLTQAQQLLAAVGLRLGNVTYQQVPDLLPNTIVDQFPRGGELATKGLAVDVFVVQGSEKKQDALEN